MPIFFISTSKGVPFQYPWTILAFLSLHKIIMSAFLSSCLLTCDATVTQWPMDKWMNWIFQRKGVGYILCHFHKHLQSSSTLHHHPHDQAPSLIIFIFCESALALISRAQASEITSHGHMWVSHLSTSSSLLPVTGRHHKIIFLLSPWVETTASSSFSFNNWLIGIALNTF